MKVTVKLFALLGRYLPPNSQDNSADLAVEDGTTPMDIIRRLNLPSEYCHLVLVNGGFVSPGERDSLALQENDVLAIWPPIAGG